MVLMKINRELQEKILKHITEKFPERPEEEFYSSLLQQYGEKEVVGTILYLKMHEMLLCNESAYLDYLESEIPNIVLVADNTNGKSF